MGYILYIWIVAAGSSGGNTINSELYRNKDLCEGAGKVLVHKIKKDLSVSATIDFHCAEK